MRKLFVLLAILTIATMLAACGGGAAGTGAAPSGGAAPTGGNADNGKVLFSQAVLAGNAGCSTCHSLEPGKVIVGPLMAGIGTRAASTVAGQTAEQYIRTSIVKTNEHLVKGCNAADLNADCPASVMPLALGAETQACGVERFGGVSADFEVNDFSVRKSNKTGPFFGKKVQSLFQHQQVRLDLLRKKGPVNVQHQQARLDLLRKKGPVDIYSNSLGKAFSRPSFACPSTWRCP